MKPLYLLLAVALAGCTIQVVPPQPPRPLPQPVEEEPEELVEPIAAQRTPSPTPVPGAVSTPRPTPSPNGGLIPVTDVAFVEVRAGGFSPDFLAVKPGGTVTFISEDGSAHELWGDLQVELKPGTAFEKRFDQVGSYTIACRTHPEDRMTVEVVSGFSGGSTPSPTPTPIPTPVPMATPNMWGSDAFVPADGSIQTSAETVLFRIPPVPGAIQYRVNLYEGQDPNQGRHVSATETSGPELVHPGLPEGEYLYQLAAYREDGTVVVSNWIRFAVLNAP